MTVIAAMQTFDYIIVGAGSAGCVLANRLSASGAHSVLLLEAGGADHHFWLKAPIGYGMTFYNPTVNWMYRTEPDAALAGRSGYWPRGRVLGGSSSINGMVFVRGQPQDFDDWAACGNPRWGWADVLPYFKRLEDSDMASGHADDWRGQGGPLHVSDVRPHVHPLCHDFLQAGVEMGLPATDDINGPQWEGMTINQITTRKGLRESASTAYLRPALKRPNLRLITHALVERVVFEGQRASGVQFVVDGQRQVAQARREVLVCGGSVNSPALLQLSGVGDAEFLRSKGISPVHHAPAVGRHLQDHLCHDHSYVARKPSLNQTYGTWSGKLWAGLRYVLARRGPMALGINHAGGFVRSDAHEARPNFQLYFSPLTYSKPTPGKRQLLKPDAEPGFSISVQPCRPTSRGFIEIRDADPRTPPRIVTNALSTDYDVDQMRKAALFIRRFSQTPAMQALIVREIAPGPNCQGEDALLQDARERAGTLFHPVSTCRMGPDPAQSVVNARLQVHGLHGLRVVDASVFPMVTSGNTNAPTLMLAERAADWILEAAGGG